MNYDKFIKTLKTLDEKQLLGLFHDIDDLEVVERIADCAYYFSKNQGTFAYHPNKEWVDKNIALPTIGTLNRIAMEEIKAISKQRFSIEHVLDAKEYQGKSDEEDAKELDEATRYRDHQSDQSRPY